MTRALEWLWLGTVPYRAAWRLQQELAALRRQGRIANDVVLMLEHDPVFTMGRNGDAAHLGAGAASLIEAGAEYIDVDRGGSVTFHGPGQLVAYPIIDIAAAFPIPGRERAGDVIAYLRALETAILATAAVHGVPAQRRPPYTGVWSADRKLAAIGVKLSHGVTTHGLALNVCTDLRWFDLVVPCGIPGAGVASLESLGATGLAPSGVAPELAAELGAVFAEPVLAATDAVRAVVEPRLPAAA